MKKVILASAAALMMGTTLLGTVGTVEAYQWNRGSLSSTERSLNQFKRDNIDRVKQYSITDKNKSRYEKSINNFSDYSTIRTVVAEAKREESAAQGVDAKYKELEQLLEEGKNKGRLGTRLYKRLHFDLTGIPYAQGINKERALDDLKKEINKYYRRR